MPSVRVDKEQNHGAYYLTFTVNRWYYLFDRHNRWDILSNSLKYCQEHKQLKIYHWVFMLNHIHLLIQSPDVSGFIRDFKSFTSKEIKKNILATEPHILKLFEDDAGNYQFWQDTNMPELIETDKFYLTKAQYIDNNPVRKGYVIKPEYWMHSSANQEAPLIKLSKLF